MRRMSRGRVLGGIATVLAVFAWVQIMGAQKQSATPAQMSVSAQRALLDQYCVGCHNQKAKVGGLSLDKLDLAHLGDNAETVEKVIRKLRAGMMPPVGSKRPDQATYQALMSSLENGIDQAV